MCGTLETPETMGLIVTKLGERFDGGRERESGRRAEREMIDIFGILRPISVATMRMNIC